MGDRTSLTPGASYKDLLFVDNAGSGVDTTIRNVETGNGANTPISTSTKVVRIKAIDTSTVFVIQDSAGNNILTVNPSTKLITADSSAKFVGDGSLLTDLPGEGDEVNVSKYYQITLGPGGGGTFSGAIARGLGGVTVTPSISGTTVTLTASSALWTPVFFANDSTNLQTMYYNSSTEYKIELHPSWDSNWTSITFALRLEV